VRAEYDPEADPIYIRLRVGQVVDSDEIREGVVMDSDAEGEVLGIELLSASRRTDNPRELAFALLGAS
jgi:uncharacterized protein YuzE